MWYDIDWHYTSQITELCSGIEISEEDQAMTVEDFLNDMLERMVGVRYPILSSVTVTTTTHRKSGKVQILESVLCARNSIR